MGGQVHPLVVEYRMPLRKNWLIRMTKDPQATIIQSRSGSIHIVRPQMQRSKGKSIRTMRFSPLVGSIAALALVVAFMSIVTSSPKTREQIDSRKSDTQLPLENLDAPAHCSDSTAVSISAVENALSGLASRLKILEKSEPIELGGYRLTSLIVQCQSQRFTVKITEAKLNSNWQLKKLARLEN